MSGSSRASFSLATSAIGPKIVTGLRNPAGRRKTTSGSHPSLPQAHGHSGCQVSLCRINYLREEQLFRRLETWFEQAEPTNPLCFSEDFSWSCADPGTARSRPGLRRQFWGACTEHWPAARLCKEKVSILSVCFKNIMKKTHREINITILQRTSYAV